MLHDTVLTNNMMAVRARFIKRVSDWIPNFETFARELTEGTGAADDLLRMHRHAHMIAGSAGTFGFAGFTLLAAELESQLEILLSGQPTDEDAEALSCALENFLVAARQIAASGGHGTKVSSDTPPAAEKINTAPHNIGLDERTPEDVESKLGDVETITRPKSDAVKKRASDVAALAQTAKREPHILIIDDDELIRNVLIEGLGSEGWRFSEAEDGVQAIMTLFKASGAARADRPDLILLDIDMPNMDGFETLKMIQSSPLWQSTPVVMLTYRDEDINMIRAFAGGVQSYMTKPVELDALKQKISTTLAVGNKQVVLATEDPELFQTLKGSLEDLPIKVITADSALDAIEHFYDRNCGLAIVDASFPKFKGKALNDYMSLDDRTRHIPVMTLEQAGDRDGLLSRLAGGAQGNMLKPVDTSEFCARVAGLLAQKENGQ